MTARTSETLGYNPILSENWSQNPDEVLRILIEQRHEEAVRFAAAVTNDRALAEDVVQKALLEIWPRIQSGVFGSNPEEILKRSWSFLRKIVYSRACDSLRPNHRTEVTNSISYVADADEEGRYLRTKWKMLIIREEQLYDFGDDDVVDLQNDFSEEAFLAQLGFSPKEVFLLIEASIGTDYLEIAGKLGVPPGTIKSRLSRLRVRLRSLLAGTEFERKPRS